MKRGVALIGFMGAGKSTVGPLLAEALDLGFVDLDKRISIQENSSIPDFFERFGEAAFRVAERKALEEVLGRGPCVLACGGGTPCQEGLLERLGHWGHVAFLDASFAAIKSRSVQGRPLWNGEVQELYQSRRATYEKAEIHLDADQEPQHIVSVALACLGFRS